MARGPIKRVADAIREQDKETADRGVREIEFAEVRKVSPLLLELHDAAIQLEEDDLILSQGIKKYQDETGLEVGDTVAVKQMRGGDYLVTDAFSTKAQTNVSATTITVGSTTTGSPGSSASVTNSGTTSAVVLDFTIPRGDTGTTGPTGPTGPAGANGSTVLNGAGAPSSGTGSNGDFYIDTTSSTIYGPKTSGAWGSGTSLIGATGSAGAGMVTGALMQYAGSAAPSGFLLCDGGQYSVTTYADLYAVVGTTFGSLTNGSGGAGSTHFRVPDLRGRVPMGAGTGAGDASSGTNTVPSGTALTARTSGAWGGAETHTLTTSQIPAHSHAAGTLTIPTHTHGAGTLAMGNHSHSFTPSGTISSHQHDFGTLAFSYGSNTAAAGSDRTFAQFGSGSSRSLSSGSTGSTTPTFTGSAGTTGTTPSSTTITGDTSSTISNNAVSGSTSTDGGTGGSHTNTQPFMVLNYIIKT